MTTQDLELQLLNLLKDNWKVDIEGTVFHRNMRRVEAEITAPNVIIAEVADVNDWSNEDMADCRAVLMVRIRFPVQGTTNDALEEAKEKKHLFRNEVYKILYWMNQNKFNVEKPEDWEWAYVTRRMNEDNFTTVQPFIGEAMHITIAYQRTIEEGGSGE